MKQIIILFLCIFSLQLVAQSGKIAAEIKNDSIAVWLDELPDLDQLKNIRLNFLSDGLIHSDSGAIYLYDTTYFALPDFDNELQVYGVTAWVKEMHGGHIHVHTGKTNRLFFYKEAIPEPPTEPEPDFEYTYNTTLGQLFVKSDMGFEVLFFTTMGIPVSYKGYPAGEILINVPPSADFCTLVFKTLQGAELVSFQL